MAIFKIPPGFAAGSSAPNGRDEANAGVGRPAIAYTDAADVPSRAATRMNSLRSMRPSRSIPNTSITFGWSKSEGFVDGMPGSSFGDLYRMQPIHVVLGSLCDELPVCQVRFCTEAPPSLVKYPSNRPIF